MDMESLFYPGSVMVIGASEDRRKPGGIVLEKLKSGGFKGNVYLVNPKYSELEGWKCYPDIESVPGPVDLAVISLKASQVVQTLEVCVAKGVKAAIIFSSGFGEVDESGIEQQKRIGEIARNHGITLCGPNTMGLINYLHNMHAAFVYGYTPPSQEETADTGIALVAQSGGIGCAMLTSCAQFGLGVDIYVCTGNEAYIDFADYIDYFVKNPRIKMIAAYLEGVRDGEKFKEVAENALAAGKPLVILKTGTHEASSKAARSHTGALAGSAAVYSAFFKQKGIINVQNISEMMAALSMLSPGKLPVGNGVAILASSGGQAVVAADKCAGAGLEVVELKEDTRMKLADYLPDYASTANPVDYTGIDIVRPGLFRECAAITAGDPGVDILLLSHWLSDEVDSLGQLRELAAVTDKPLALMSMIPGQVSPEKVPYLLSAGVSYIGEIDSGVRAISGIVNHRSKKNLVREPVWEGHDIPEELEYFRNLNKRTLIGEYELRDLFSAYGIPAVSEKAASSAEEAVEAAGELGYPVVMKVDSSDIAHKTEAGGICLNLESPNDVLHAYTSIITEAGRNCPGASINGVLVQKMVGGGVEVLVGLSRDPVFGLTLTFGLGGIWVEILKDVSMRVLPVGENDIREMIKEIKGYPLLAGFRGKPPVDFEALVQVIKGVARLGMDWPELEELDINPLYVLPDGEGAYVVDAVAAI